jgi:hypothetical protein
MKTPKHRDKSIKNVAKITSITGVVTEGNVTMIQFATAEHKLADILLPIEEAVKLAVHLARDARIRDLATADKPPPSRH